MQTLLWQKIDSLEKEIKILKSLAQESQSKKKIKKVSKRDPLKGILKGVHFSEEAFEEAKNALFNEGHLLYLKHKK